MSTPNPYAPPQVQVADVVDPRFRSVEAAERGTRLVAAILDGLIFAAMVYAPFIGVAAAAGITRQPGRDMTGPMLAGVAIACVGFVVWAWLTLRNVRANGQSIAKKMLHIKVVRSDGSPISVSRIFWLRNVANGALSIIPMYGLIDVLFIFAEQRQCVHDKLADTIVVKA